MEVTSDFIARLRRKLSEELAFTAQPEEAPEVLAAFDRAALATVLNGSGPVENPFSERARKAAATRAKNKRAKAQDPRNTGGEGNASAASDD